MVARDAAVSLAEIAHVNFQAPFTFERPYVRRRRTSRQSSSRAPGAEPRARAFKGAPMTPCVAGISPGPRHALGACATVAVPRLAAAAEAKAAARVLDGRLAGSLPSCLLLLALTASRLARPLAVGW